MSTLVYNNAFKIFNFFSPSDEEPGSWEESYLNFDDSKPRGPEAIALDFTFQQAEVLFGLYFVIV